MIATVILLICAGVAKAVMDTLQFHWSSSVFYRWSQIPTAFGDLIGKWMGPDSWKNKNIPKNQILLFLTRGPLVFLTDGWHFFQFLFLSFLQAALIIHLPPLIISPFWSFVIYLFIAKLVMGIPFELFWSHLLISPSSKKTARIGERNLTFWDYYSVFPKRMSQLITVLTFTGLIVAYTLGAPVGLVVVGVFGFFLLMIYLMQRGGL